MKRSHATLLSYPQLYDKHFGRFRRKECPCKAIYGEGRGKRPSIVVYSCAVIKGNQFLLTTGKRWKKENILKHVYYR